ncbi:MAG: esterase family protein [Gammaproteobacteria bacterium]|nr:esterase family protein [Gammaproteobacteria bacterium]MBU1507999.1 esterase family protein [Gammaproteobacteria bacterium]MBU2123647.1 esterase family protein [Gammaproteobacteria bacterium]MBU2173179.1 esterase family protein [Gammaproteobacteria bacterium]MBU2199377.1 esterase family protein [Gammaproteobacteria bacterium]
MHQEFHPARRVALLSIAGALAACGGGGSGDNGAPPQTVGQVINSSLRSSANGNTYPIQVYLPQSYATGTASLPVIYATEGDAPFGSSSPYFNGSYGTRFDAFKDVMQRRGTQAILVGIGGTAWRTTDFLVPGASRYLDFIVKELAVSIERQYRADPKRRVLSGLSHGGYFVLAALVLEAQAGVAPSFSHYLSTEISVGEHTSVAGVLAFEKLIDGKPLLTTLVIAGARNGNHRLIGMPLYNQMAAQNLPGLVLLKAEYDASHVGADVPAFEDAVKRFFP